MIDRTARTAHGRRFCHKAVSAVVIAFVVLISTATPARAGTVPVTNPTLPAGGAVPRQTEPDIAITPHTAPVSEDTAAAAALTDPDGDDDKPDIHAIDVAAAFRPSCVRIAVYTRPHDGTLPPVGDYRTDLRYERPTLIGGYWWNDTHVIIPDDGLQDQYIDYMEIQTTEGGPRYDAVVVGRFVLLQAVLLEVLPDENGRLPDSRPLAFADGDPEDGITVKYVWDEGEWRLRIGSGVGGIAFSDDGLETLDADNSGVVLNSDLKPIGLAFGDRVGAGDNAGYWNGADVAFARLWSWEEAREREVALRRDLTGAVLESCFGLRIRVEDDDADDPNAYPMGVEDEANPHGPSEIRAPALVVGKRHLLVPLPLSAEGIAKIETIAVVLPDGREVDATFAGALRDYMAVVLEVDAVLPTESVPPGFGLLNPLAAPDRRVKPEARGRELRPLLQLFQRWHIDFSLGRRRERVDFDRWLGTHRGYRGDTIVTTWTNESDGALAFDIDGDLVAVALTPRIKRSSAANGDIMDKPTAISGFRPIDVLHTALLADNAFDPTLRPIAEEQGRRLIDLGVEFQSLDQNTARLFKAVRETRGGRIGLLVTHIYPGSVADEIGLREEDILLRLNVEGERQSIELRSSDFYFNDLVDDSDMSPEMLRMRFQYLPPPWPNRENVVSTLLTAFGPGRNATLTYLRDGVEMTADFTTAYFEPDYRSAKREKFPALGLTAKPITFEVARYFGLNDKNGVIISKVEDGGKASVAGLHRYLIITQVNGRPVTDLDDFAEKVRSVEDGSAPSVELTVAGFGKTRLVKLE
ncbi:MAG: hypothetical protein LUG50_01980 [Planctomycetaceae bacterium]|nr:hypothetical protein [Planctomycetaceae bacterium]